jgi:hypothetical protein
MRKLTFTAAVVVALAAASIAVAHGIEGAKTAKSVAATFTASAGSTTTRTCTTAEGKVLTITTGKYTGTASGDADLTGALTIAARSTINTTDGVGLVDGQLRIDVAGGRDTMAAFSTVYDHGNIAGLAAGRARDPHLKLLGNISAGFVPASGFTSGKLGGGTAGGGAVEIGPGSCQASKPQAEKSEAHGTITALSTTSITVAGLTCNVPADMASDLNAKFKVNDRAEIRCALSNGQNTLTKIERKR